MSRYKFFTIDQPMGRFYVASINASIIIPLSQSNERTPYNDTGIQRKLTESRVSDIAKYCESDNAMFPTPIILSGKSDFFSFYNQVDGEKIEYGNLESGYLEIDDENIISRNEYLSIVDGQHRLAGIEKSGRALDFDLLIMFIFDTEAYQDAEIFSVINRNQKQVSPSLVYDLYGLSNDMTVEKYAHEIVNALNTLKCSKLKKRIKMLGYKTDNFDDDGKRIKQYVSQAALAYDIILLTSSNSAKDNKTISEGDILDSVDDDSKVLRKYLANDQINLAQIHMISFFNEWIEIIEKKYDENSIMFKTVVFVAAFEVFKQINIKKQHLFSELNEKIKDNNSLNEDEEIDAELMEKISAVYKEEIGKLKFDSVIPGNISSSRSGAARLAKLLLDTID